MLLKNASYLDENWNIVTGDLIIEDGVIKLGYENNSENDDNLIDCHDYIIIPGLFNAHFHGYSLLAKGLAKEMKIESWCNDTVQGKIQTKFFENLDQLSSEEYESVCLKANAEMVKNGITFVSENEPAYWPELVAGAIEKIGMRGILDTHTNIEDYYQKNVGNVSFGTHLLEEEDITEETLEECVRKKREFDSIYMTHCMENDWRKDIIYKNFERSSLELYNEKGLLDEKTVLYHGVHMNEKDIEIVAEANASVVHCPNSNLWSGAGMAPISSMLEKGVNVCLGTDFGSVDIWETMKTSYYLLKLGSPFNRYQAVDIFMMATVNGAKAYQQKRLGAIKEGYKADLVFIKKDSLIPQVNREEFSTIVHNLLFETRVEHIRHVMIDGKWVMFDRVLLTMDEKELDKNFINVLEKVYNSII
ncbi:5-methylthioadenosine/S-adenosylhomocysteine deaminase [Bacillus sp. SORGH_AS 510]|uniref:amidohydrolase family protein n=1 Tax=Bacillus sp. SORGH_AS_0510 TaxID=3041771 RepID=UPI00277D2785|nr:amidohydrolase family protein [Bacillus sp. SORGH_AS_0510]MDQ1146657.1 5-methylthioadenosine/S-adenosylhomocysteine deaminase [Bacillus sp. SORGH_AS_0510]